MTKALYIGAGTDILPVIVNPDIKNFIYIDSQPKSQYGDLGFGEKLFFCKNFLDNLNNIMRNNNFKLIENSENYLKYFNETTKQTINYYINTVISDKITKTLKNIIETCNILICIGHDPHKEILNYIKKPFIFIGSVHTCYKIEQNNIDKQENSTFIELYNNPSLAEEYRLIKDKKYYDFLKHDKINNKIISNFDIVKFNNLKDLEVIRKKTFNEFYDF